jgi:hypothetical protein
MGEISLPARTTQEQDLRTFGPTASASAFAVAKGVRLLRFAVAHGQVAFFKQVFWENFTNTVTSRDALALAIGATVIFLRSLCPERGVEAPKATGVRLAIS